jgi:dimeric dUTPase (all-alpha-NTP-PPase superfamily)
MSRILVNLTKLINDQGKLNAVILKNAKLKPNQVYEELKLALLVEIGELANTIRSFKY